MNTTAPTSRPQLVYLVFGAETYHQEAVFSIASALSFLRDEPDTGIDIQVFTDNPEPYRLLPVRVRPLDEATRKRWSEPHGYHFRTKHVVLRQVLQESEVALLIDTDTFFHHSPLALFERVQPGTLLCNAFYTKYGDNHESILYSALYQRLLDMGVADDDMMTLNSGVMGLTQQDAHILDRSIELMDELFPHAQGAYTLEEFCLSIAAYRTLNVRECPDLIHHYWSRKQLFRAKVKAWIAKHGANPTSATALDDTRQVSAHLPRPPRLQRLMYKLITLALPKHQQQFIREILYGCYEHENEFDQACGPVWWDKARQNQEERQGRPVDAHLLEHWFGNPVVRLILGERREAIYEHLIKSPGK
ncbi:MULTISPECIES: hypothetical protein [unclassified Pseudomonas]|uniref:hypothetical protein n=1 Tax=unclassified Pseudomonas TaxID=196821 RepID=UPI000C86E270|nr:MULTISPECIES: hypothetical protein [unclassified Pseudomonas]NWA34307.1 hypothetical protein [Pseudomonas sp. C6002]PMU28313.1 hypothetical protein C1X90_02020 [Pseudomonas sp. GP01-A9]PMU28624.1 hypothetical protein C1X88_17365 [Pseudomonas sp. GP01-A13]PMU39177.1 hypothetical protein C1X89_14550 [Pseudomonas sp. GP01-A8]PMU53438.1 hypothetical protein C1X87_08595 [Pseudomonas sp. GP01-A14]|eukprot:gene20185-23987_t